MWCVTVSSPIPIAGPMAICSLSTGMFSRGLVL